MGTALFTNIALLLLSQIAFGRVVDFSGAPPDLGTRFYSTDSMYWAEIERGNPWSTPIVGCGINLYAVPSGEDSAIWSIDLPHQWTPNVVLISDKATFVVLVGDFERSTAPVSPIIIFDRRNGVEHQLSELELGDLSRFNAGKNTRKGSKEVIRKRWWDSAAISGGILKLGYYDKPEYEGWMVPDQRLKIELSAGKVIYDSRIPPSMESSLYYDEALRIESEIGFENGVEYFDSLVSTGWRDEYGLRMALGFARNSGNPKAALKFLDLLFETCGCVSLREASDTPPFDLIGGGGAEDTAAYLKTRTWLLKDIEGLEKRKKH